MKLSEQPQERAREWVRRMTWPKLMEPRASWLVENICGDTGTVAQLAATGRREVLSVGNVGRKTVDEVARQLSACGVQARWDFVADNEARRRVALAVLLDFAKAKAHGTPNPLLHVVASIAHHAGLDPIEYLGSLYERATFFCPKCEQPNPIEPTTDGACVGCGSALTIV